MEKEYNVLYYLCGNEAKAVSYEGVLHHVWRVGDKLEDAKL
jgi:DNA-binding response OmpR family regulator